MMRTAPFHSRDVFYKSIFGSVEAHRAFRLSVLLPRDGYVLGVVAVFDRDGTGEHRFELLDDGNSLEGGFYTRSCEISLDEGLYFYRFIMYTVEGERSLLNKGGGLGEFDPPGGLPWQLTVYEAGFETPKHTRGGIIYQIFPDRFFRGQNKLPYPEDRLLRDDWGGQPAYTQTAAPMRLGNDYFGGNLDGIIRKLDYLKTLGVTMIYLNPIFEAHSNHRYNTADYLRIDPLLGSEEDFIRLCRRAREKGIDILLDGVFSHTGDDSVYFNSKKRYGEGGAYNDPASPYFSWYKFRRYNSDYACWWGIKTLPEVNEDDLSFTEFITGENGVIRYWMRRGAAGFRLDVADELPDGFLDRVREAVKSENPDGYLLGEVWEDATNKISYSARRRFLRGRQLDSVMNYPFADAIIDFILGGTGNDFAECILTVAENYPPPALHNLMNHIGTHDTARILTRLAGRPPQGRGRDWQSKQKLSAAEYETGVRRLKMAATLQYSLPGIPSLYYGDEAGMEGYSDPFCRGCFPWDNPDAELTDFYRELGQARIRCPAFAEGNITFLAVGLGYVVYERRSSASSAIVGVNRWNAPETVELGLDLRGYRVVFGNPPAQNRITLDGESCIFLISGDEKNEE